MTALSEDARELPAAWPSTGAPARASIAAEVWRLAWPAILHMLLLSLAFIVSRVIVGRHSTEALAALQLGSVVVWTMYSLLTAASAGTLAVVARSVGAGDRAGARAAACGAIGFAAAVGAVVAVASGLAAGPLLSLLFPRVDPAVLAGATEYVQVTAVALPFAFVEAVAAAAIQGSGDTRLPLAVAGLGNLVNLTLTFGLVFGRLGLPALGLRGAAIGSASTMFVEGVVLGAVVLGGRSAGLRAPAAPRAAREGLSRVLAVSAPAYAEKAVYHAGYGLFMATLGLLGSAAIAANQALMSIEAVSFLTADGFGIAAAAVAAQKLGAGRPELSARAGWAGAGLATAALTACGLAFVIAPRVLVAPFAADPEVVELGARTLLAAAIAQPFMGFATVVATTLRGAGDTRSVLWITVAGSLVARPIATWLFAVTLGGGLVGLWLGSLVDWLVRAALAGAVFARGDWQRARA